jgi:ribonuclease HII
MLILGIDDSGRGPIIGPMVLAGCLINEEMNKEFREDGVKDSKQLSAKRRESLAKIIMKKAKGYEVVQASPDEIEAKMNSHINLNTIEAMKAAEIINKLNDGKEQIRVIMDCPSPNCSAWGEEVKRMVEKKGNLEFVAEHKADVNHPSVSAASIQQGMLKLRR